MNKIELSGLGQNVYYEELKNGLKVILIPNKNKKNYYAVYGTKYGAMNLSFKYNGEYYDSDMGVAHFLEHKMFEQEDGIDPFEFFNKSGTGCNASTSYKKTVYYIYGNKELEKNLDFLISYVNSPYFTDKNVEKEKGIIIQEAKMYEDSPDWTLYEGLNAVTFKNHPIRYSIAGYTDTINNISKEELDICYDTFYNPNNMYLVVSGYFDRNSIMKVIKNNKLLNARKKKTIELKPIVEKEEVFEKEKTIKKDVVELTKVGLSLKISTKDRDDAYKFYLYLTCLVNLLYGSTSDFKQKIYEKKLVSSFFPELNYLNDFILIQFFMDSNKPKEITDLIIESFKEKITKEDFEREIKAQISAGVLASDNIEAIADSIISDYVNYGKIISNKKDIIKSLDYDELLKIRDSINLENHSVLIVDKK